MFPDRGYLGNFAAGLATDAVLGWAELCGLTRTILKCIANVGIVIKCVVVAVLYEELTQILAILWAN